MFAFIVNGIAIAIGGFIGLLFKNRIKKEICDSVLKVIGLVVFLIGLSGVLENMITVENGRLVSNGALILIISVALGTFIGEFCKIETRLNDFSVKLEKKINKGAMAEGLITATLIYCVGSMTIIGSMESALGKPDTIYLKSVIDGITSIVLASTLGFGVLFSSFGVIIYQGLLTLLFYFLGNFMPSDLITLISMVGYSMVLALGLNFLIKDKVRVSNMLPSIIVVVIYYLIQGLF